jgi:hypothetical protein
MTTTPSAAADAAASPLERRISLLTDAVKNTNENLMTHLSTVQAHGQELERTQSLLNGALVEIRDVKKEIAAIGSQLGVVVIETDGRIAKVEDGVAGFAWLGKISRHPLVTPLSVVILVLLNIVMKK